MHQVFWQILAWARNQEIDSKGSHHKIKDLDDGTSSSDHAKTLGKFLPADSCECFLYYQLTYYN